MTTMIECDSELEAITDFIHRELITKHGFRAIEKSPINPPGHIAHFDEMLNGEIFPSTWKDDMPARVEILYRNKIHPEGHFKLTGSVNEISTHRASGHSYLDIDSSDSDAEESVRRATYVLTCHIFDSTFKYHLPSEAKAMAEDVKNPYIAVKKVSISLPVVKYAASFVARGDAPCDSSNTSIDNNEPVLAALLVPHHVHSTKSKVPKKFHIIPEKKEKLAMIVASVARDICDLRELEPEVVVPIGLSDSHHHHEQQHVKESE